MGKTVDVDALEHNSDWTKRTWDVQGSIPGDLPASSPAVKYLHSETAVTWDGLSLAMSSYKEEDHPRDEDGQWIEKGTAKKGKRGFSWKAVDYSNLLTLRTTDKTAPPPTFVPYKGSHFKDDVKSEILSRLQHAADLVGDDAPPIVAIELSELPDNVLGMKSIKKVYISHIALSDKFMAKTAKEWDGLIIGGHKSIASTVTHEYGHIVDNYASRRNNKRYNRLVWDYVNEEIVKDGRTAKRYQWDHLDGKSFYAQEEPWEWIAEAFNDVVFNGDGAADSAKELFRRLKECLK